ncbi:MAG: alpha-L-rhamnosidase N-terminal domain-containing protein [Candidatus Hydrogenedentes bacterium]|nr:alpha-L-rhamnosidase N-terminal domain-containing protein [Candidatus Hydrogenedentota bacterium]
MVVFAMLTLIASGVNVNDVGQSLQDAMIWASSAPAGTQAYVVFRKSFQVDAPPAKATLYIFADSRYILWVNGRYVERGPCRFDPVAPSYDSIDIFPHIHAGANTIAVLVHHYHDGRPTDDPTPLNGRTMRHAPGLAARVDLADASGNTTTLQTDRTWRCSARTRFTLSPISWGWIPDRIDARLDAGDWTDSRFDDNAWESAAPVDGRLWGNLTPRPILPLRETKLTPATLVRHSPASSDPMPWAQALPLTLKVGDEAVLDVGRAVLAYGVFDLEAEAGATLEVVHGHGYRDGRLDETYDSDQYVAKEGRQVYMSGDVCGFRYLLLKATSGAITLHAVDVVDRVYPFDVAGKFDCSAPFLNELWTRSVKTVLLCSEDGYTDCTARERTEWMGDSAFIEYPLTRVVFATGDGQRRWGDPSLIANMLRHIAQSQQPDGRLKAHHPSNRWDIHGYIEDYACLWLQTLRRYYDNTLDAELVRRLWPNVVRQLDWFMARRTEHGLVKARDFMFFDNPLSYKECEGATLNAYLYGALSDAAYLAHVLGDPVASDTDRAVAHELAHRFHEALWDESEGAYHGGILDGAKTDCTAHAAMMALYCDIVPPECRARTCTWLAAHRSQIGSPYAHAPFLEVL